MTARDHANVDSLGGALLVLLVLLATLLAGCEDPPPPISVHQTDNTHYQVAKLFTVDGCAVYRFEDGGRDHYALICGGTSVEHHENCGKSCWYPDDVPTVVRR